MWTGSYTHYRAHVLAAVCRQMSMGVAAIFGPMSGPSASHVQTVSTRLDVPHVEARLDCRDEAAKAHDRIAINIFPHCQTLNRALADLLDHWQWDQVTMAVLYETNDGTSLSLTLLHEHLFSLRKVYSFE